MVDTIFGPCPLRFRLRPCLSPSRYPLTPSSTPLSSQRPSFSSDTSFIIKSKSVRWEAGSEDCAVTSYFQTYSAQEYDRTPLAPPSEEERACALPERDARRLDKTVEQGEVRTHSLPLPTPEAEDGEENDWEETVDRRRMMFARSLAGNGASPCAEFTGYRSFSASLATLLASIEDDVPTPTSAASSTPSSPEYRAIPTLPHDVFNRLTSLCLPERICESPCEEDEEDDTPSLTSSATSSASESVLASPQKGIFSSEAMDVPGVKQRFDTGDGPRDRDRSRTLCNEI